VTAAAYLYLWLNIATFLLPFAFSFYPAANFSRKWRFVFPAILGTAIVFILWDEWFTRVGIWGFNPKYLTGIYILSLPIEEVLFFFCIPYACVFTYYALNRLIRRDYFASFHRWITLGIIVALVVGGCINLHRLYTSITFLITAVFLLFVFVGPTRVYMGRFYLAFLVLLLPFFMVNGILTGSLTGEPVVWYNDSESMGIRIGTIPLEDLVYCMLLLLINIWIAAWLEERYTGTEGRR